jgi:serine/threonine protein phosphatase 1
MSIKYFTKNTNGRDFICGDIHGCYDALMESISCHEFDKTKDRLFSVGDLVDRGPDSFKCLELVFEPWFHAVRGNHEMLMIDGINNPKRFDLWLMNGGAWSYEEDPNTLKIIAEESVAKMPYAIELDIGGFKIGIVHAEVCGSDWERMRRGTFNAQSVTWNRSKIENEIDDNVSGIDAVVSGHSIVTSPVKLGNQYFIDTGSFCTGNITVIDVESLRDI